MGNDNLRELSAYGLHRIEGRLGVLKHQRHCLAAQLPPEFLRGGHQVNAIKQDAAAHDGAVVGQQAHYGQGQGAFAGAAFAHDAEDFLLVLGKGYAIDGADGAVGGAELHPQILNLQEGRHCRPSDGRDGLGLAGVAAAARFTAVIRPALISATRSSRDVMRRWKRVAAVAI